MLALLPTWLRLGAVALLGGMIAAGPVYLYGHSKGREAERVAVLKRSVDLLRERNATDEAVNGMDDAGLCAALDGVWVPDERRCE
jgi:hypothetical protein